MLEGMAAAYAEQILSAASYCHDRGPTDTRILFLKESSKASPFLSAIVASRFRSTSQGPEAGERLVLDAALGQSGEGDRLWAVTRRHSERSGICSTRFALEGPTPWSEFGRIARRWGAH